jgi:hypothetical protein
LLVFGASQKVRPLYEGEAVLLTDAAAAGFLKEFSRALAQPEAPGLDELFNKHLTGMARYYRGRTSIEALRFERARWTTFTLSLVEPTAAPVRLPGGRWRLEPAFTLQARRTEAATPEPPVPLRFTFDLAHVDGRWRIVGYWSHGNANVTLQPDGTASRSS